MQGGIYGVELVTFAQQQFSWAELPEETPAIVKIPVSFFHNLSTGQLEDNGVHHAIVVVRRTIAKALQDSLSIENEQHMIRVDELQRQAGFVLIQPIQARRLSVTERRQFDSGSGLRWDFGRETILR